MDKPTIVYTFDLERESYIRQNKENGINCIGVSDVRTAVYIAVGMAARSSKNIIVCVRGNNASRSAFAGLTEAFYRQLPVTLISFGKQVDYSRELADIIFNHYVVVNTNEINPLLNNKKPMHIEVKENEQITELVSCRRLHEKLASVLSKEDYIFFSKNIEDSSKYKCKKVIGGMQGCYDGAIANVLGASLAKKRRKYVGVFSEEEFKHDINTLGNININDSLIFIILIPAKNPFIQGYATSLGYKVYSFTMNGLSLDDLHMIIKEGKKTILLIQGET